MLYLIIFMAVMASIWFGYKQMNAKKVKGRKAEIMPFRQNSHLSPLGTITVTLMDVKKKGDEIWFICPLANEMQLGDFKFDYIMLRAKSDDDDLNTQKAVVCYVNAGHMQSGTPHRFIDWGLVKVL